MWSSRLVVTEHIIACEVTKEPKFYFLTEAETIRIFTNSKFLNLKWPTCGEDIIDRLYRVYRVYKVYMGIQGIQGIQGIHGYTGR